MFNHLLIKTFQSEPIKKIIKDGILAETGSPYFSCLASDKANRTTGFDMINSGYNAQYNLMATCALEDATTVNAGVGPIFDTDVIFLAQRFLSAVLV